MRLLSGRIVDLCMRTHTGAIRYSYRGDRREERHYSPERRFRYAVAYEELNGRIRSTNSLSSKRSSRLLLHINIDASVLVGDTVALHDSKTASVHTSENGAEQHLVRAYSHSFHRAEGGYSVFKTRFLGAPFHRRVVRIHGTEALRKLFLCIHEARPAVVLLRDCMGAAAQQRIDPWPCSRQLGY